MPPHTKYTIRMSMVSTTRERPYTAKYKLTYTDGVTNTVEDEGINTNVWYSKSDSSVVAMEKCLETNC